MKTTLNPFENAKRTASGTGGGVSPAVIEEMQAEISILGSQNKTQAQDITDIKDNLTKTSSADVTINSTYFTVASSSVSTCKIGKFLSHTGFVLAITDPTTEIPKDTELFRIAHYGRININDTTFIAGRHGDELHFYTEYDNNDNTICVVKTGQSIQNVSSIRGEFTKLHDAVV